MRTSRSTSALAEPKTPWLYPYREDPQQTRLGQPVFRPFVPVSLATSDVSTPELEGLIDTGADAILASDLLADELGLNLADNEGEELHAVGGRTVVARYKTVSLRLHYHEDSGARHEWEAPVGFVIRRWLAQLRPGPTRQRRLPRPLHGHRESLLPGGRSRGPRPL